MNNHDIENVNNLSINNELNMNNRQIKNLGDGNEDGDTVNVKQLNEMETNVTNYVISEFGKVNPVLSNNSDLIKAINRNLIRNDSKLLIIKELYFPDSVEGRTQNNYTYKTNSDNNGDVNFYLTLVHKITTSDNMIITLNWEGGIHPIYIFVTKYSLVVSENPLINEPILNFNKIPSYSIGKQLYFWIIIQNDIIKIFLVVSLDSAGHRQFCLYDDVIKMASWYNSQEVILAPKFCPSIFVYGCLVLRVPVPWKEDRQSFHSKQSEMASDEMCRRILYSKPNCGT